MSTESTPIHVEIIHKAVPAQVLTFILCPKHTVGRRIKRHVGDLDSVTAGNDGVVNVSTEDSGSHSQVAIPSLDV